MKSTLRLVCALLAGLPVIVNSPARAELVIDSFSTFQSAPGIPASESTADGPGILGGERDMDSLLIVSINGAVPNQAYFAYPDGPSSPASAGLSYDGNDDSASVSYYGGLGSVDLTQGGVNDRFRFYISSIVTGGSPINLTLLVKQVAEGSAIQIPLPMTAGVWEIPFSALLSDGSLFPANFTHVGYLDIRFRMTPGQSLVIDQISAAVPEPSSLSLVMALGAGTFFTRVVRRKLH